MAGLAVLTVLDIAAGAIFDAGRAPVTVAGITPIAVGLTDQATHIRIQHIARHSRLARTRHTRDDDEAPDRNTYVGPLDVMERDPFQLQAGRVVLDCAQRLRGMQQRLSQEFSGNRAGVAHQVLYDAGP